MSSTTKRKSHIRPNSPRAEVLRTLRDAHGEIEYNDFRRLLGKHYSTQNAMNCAFKEMVAKGLIQRSIRLTASGSAMLNRADDKG